MTLEEIYYIGQSVAVIAILASLVAIFFQLRQSQKMEQAATQRALTTQAQEWNESLSGDPELFDIVARLLAEYETAEPYDKARFGAWCMKFAFILLQSIHLRDDDFVREATYRQLLTVFYALTDCPGGKQWWESSGRPIFSPFVVDHIEQNRGTFNRTVTSIEEIWPELKDHREALKAQP